MKIFGWFKKHWLISLALSTILLIFGSIGGWFPADKMAQTIIRPAGNALSRLGQKTGSYLNELSQIGSLSEENKRLREDNARLFGQLAELDQLRLENQQLRAQLDFNSKQGFESVEAQIINYQPDSIRQFIRVNRGRKSGVREGDPVVASGNLLGVVKKATASTSDVQLITDGDFRVLVRVLGTQAPGIIKGRPPSGLKLERVPLDKPLQRDQIVVSSGLDGQFPAGIILGRILDADSGDEAIFKSAQVEPAVQLIQTSIVSILINLP